MNLLARVRPVILVVPAVLLFFFLSLDSMVKDSPTMDEQNHLARGLAFLRTGDPRLSLEHPPLVNSLSALPLLSLPDIKLPTDHPSWERPEGWYEFADQLLWVYNQDVTRMIFLARLPIVFLGVGLALIGFRFAKEFWGRAAAISTLFFLLFDPNLLANSRYATTDVGGTTFLFLAFWMLWRLWKSSEWSWIRLLAAGIGLGLAMGSKLSNLVFLPIFVLLCFIPAYGKPWHGRDALHRLIRYILAGSIGLVVLWLIFGAEWRTFTFQTASLTHLNRFSGPMPTFWAGVEQILRVSGGGRPAFLLGNFSTEGWRSYFPVAFAVKTPVLVIILFIVASIYLLKFKASRSMAIFLLLPPVWYFLVSVQSDLNIGYRHLLPILPFFYVLSSGITVLEGKPDSLSRTGELLTRGGLYGALLSVLLIDLLLHPHALSYFNILVGGPSNGHNILIDSNIDWGQDLIRLKEWMVENEVDQVKLSWFGTADPAYYEIDYVPLPGLPRHFDLWWDVPFSPSDPEPGVYAISVSNLEELPLDKKTVFPWFRNRKPDDRIGYSIHLYFVSD